MKRLVLLGLAIGLMGSSASTSAHATPKKQLKMMEAKLDMSLTPAAPLKGGVEENLVVSLQKHLLQGTKQTPVYGNNTTSPNSALESTVNREAWSSNKVASGSWGVSSGSWNSNNGSWNVQNNNSLNSNNNSGSWNSNSCSWNVQNNGSWNNSTNSGSWGVKSGSWNSQNSGAWDKPKQWFVQPDGLKIQDGSWNVQSGSWGLQIGSWMNGIASLFRLQ